MLRENSDIASNLFAFLESSAYNHHHSNIVLLPCCFLVLANINKEVLGGEFRYESNISFYQTVCVMNTQKLREKT
jgi:hypothetical protein